MIDAPLALAFAAGLVATLNPCGFAMLPAYLSYFIGTGDAAAETRAATLSRALFVGVVVSAGFLMVFGLAGILITAGFQAVTEAIPWIALAVGGGIVVLGVAMLRGFELTVAMPKATRAGRGTGVGTLFAFGVSYAVASLSCTLPVFLSVVALQAQRTDFVSGVATFLVYGLGMSMLLIGVTLTIGLGQQSLVRRLRRSVRYVNRLAGAILVLAGAYIVWFWSTNLAAGADALGNAGAFRFVENLSQRAFAVIGDHPLAWGLGLASTIGAAVAYVITTTRRAGDPPDGGEGERREPVSSQQVPG
jgi:cytochrome c biogenesis protein CcdA